MSAQEVAELVSKRVHRRRFVAKAGKAAAAAMAVLTTIPARKADAHSSHWCNDWDTVRYVGCCELGYYATCSDWSCFTLDPSKHWWVWTCCNGYTIQECYECCNNRCSKSAGYSCHCGGASKQLSVGRLDTASC